MWGQEAAEKIVELLETCDSSDKRLLDIGSGGGQAAAFFEHRGIDVTCVDLGTSRYARRGSRQPDITGDFNEIVLTEKFDVVWASHVLEHQKNVNAFLVRCKDALEANGVLAITVPPMKQHIVGGHLTVWNAGLLLYNLVIAGFDCSKASILSYGYNISVIVENSQIDLPDNLDFDCGDLEKLRLFLPESCGRQGFDGRITRQNW